MTPWRHRSRPICCSSSPTHPRWQRCGDAILAGVATGVFKDFSVAKQWAEYIEPMEPSQENHQRYMDYFDLYKRLYEHVKEDFKELGAIADSTRSA